MDHRVFCKLYEARQFSVLKMLSLPLPPSSTTMADKDISRTVGSKQLQDDTASEDRDVPLRD